MRERLKEKRNEGGGRVAVRKNGDVLRVLGFLG